MIKNPNITPEGKITEAELKKLIGIIVQIKNIESLGVKLEVGALDLAVNKVMGELNLKIFQGNIKAEINY